MSWNIPIEANENGMLDCPYCMFETVEFSEMYRHINRHSPIKMFFVKLWRWIIRREA